ncbi:MAG: TIGR04104 family putative zinc finger protein [Ruminococcus sp.]
MFKLPVCPHCKTIYRYKDVKKELNKKESTCYHCGKKFKTSKKKILILFLIIAFITAIFDVLALYMIAGTNLIGMIIMNIIAVTAGFFLIPYFVEFKK